eukprot:4069260-Pleurochrysis_carterae.AAC.1
MLVIGPLMHGPIGRCHGLAVMPVEEQPHWNAFDHFLTRLRRSRVCDTHRNHILRGPNGTPFKDCNGNIKDPTVYDCGVMRFNSQNFRHSASVTYSPIFATRRVATGWPHLHSKVHPHINILLER